MKFKCIEDLKLFLLEIKEFSLVENFKESDWINSDGSWNISEKYLDKFKKNRGQLYSSLYVYETRRLMESIDFGDFDKPATESKATKSKRMKDFWRSNRVSMVKSIRNVRKGLEGKRINKSISKALDSQKSFLKSSASGTGSDFSNATFSSDSPSLGSGTYFGSMSEGIGYDKAFLLKVISSLKTHIYTDKEYYKPIHEDLDYSLFLEVVIPILSNIEENVFEGNLNLDESECDLLLRFLGEEEVVKYLQEKFPRRKILETFNRIKANLTKKNICEESVGYYHYIVSSILQK